MAVSSTTYCASWHRDLMRAAVNLTSAVALAILVAACGPASDNEQQPARLPGGFELAMAKQAASDAPQADVIDLSVEDVEALIQAGNVRLIDVRRDDEVAQGMIPGAEHIPLDAFDPAQLDLSDGREVVLYCRSGRRSTIAALRMAEHTGKPAKHLQGGYLAWSDANPPE